MEDILDTFLVRVDGGKPAGDAANVKRLMKNTGKLCSLSKAKARHEIAGAIDALSKQLEDIAKLRGRYTADDIVPKPAATKGLDPRLSALYTKVRDRKGDQRGVNGSRLKFIAIGKIGLVLKYTPNPRFLGTV